MSKILATKNVASVLIGIGLVLALAFAFATPAKADVISDLQAQINALLAQISALQGGTPTTSGACITFTRNHSMGNTGGEVMDIQKFLNSASDTMVATTGAGSPGNETSYFGGLTKAAVVKFQNKYAANILTPVGLSAGTGYWGPSSRAKANSLCAGVIPGVPGVPGVPITGNGLKVALASDNPTFGALVQGQAIAELAKFTFQNPTASPVTVTNLGFKRIGVSSDSTLANVYLFQGATRLTDSAGVSNTAFNFNASTGIFTLAPGASATISVRSDIAASTNGQQVGVQLVSVAASGALDTSVVLPISGTPLLISSATLATVDFAATTLPAVNTNLTPANDVVVWQNTATIGTRAVNLESFQLRNLGSIAVTDIRNLRLFVDGVQVGAAVANLTTGETSVAWDLSAAPKRLESGGRVIKVVGDIVGGSSLTAQFSLRRAADARLIDTELNQPVLSTHTSATAFSARTSGLQTIGSASVSVVKANTSPSASVTLGGSNVLWAKFELRASGEDVKIESLNVNADTSTGAQAGLDNGKVFVDGVQVGSTKDLTDATDIEFTFGSSFIAKAGALHIIDIYADAKSSTGTALTTGQTALITLDDGSSNAFGQVSLTSVSVPGSDVAANTLTISSATLTATKFSGYGDQTIIAGTSNTRLGSFTLSSGSTEGTSVNTIVVDLSANEAASITDLRLIDNSTGAQIGSTKAAPGTSNSYSVNFNVPVSSTKTIDVVGNIKSGSNAGPWHADIDTSSGGTGINTGNSVTIGSDLTLQTITVGSGTLTDAVGVSPDNANAIAGSSDVKVGNFKFTAQYSGFTVQELKVKVPANVATSVSAVTLKYKDAAGTTQSTSAALALSTGAAQTHSTATFTGLTFYIPQNTEQSLDVYVSIPTIASGATVGSAITVLLDANEGFRSVDSAGTASTTLAAGDLDSSGTSGKGTMYVRKSIPTLSSTPIATALSNGSNQVLGRFNVTADAAGDIGWKYITFTVGKSTVDIGATSTVLLWQGSNTIAGNFATTTGALVGGLEAFPAAAGSDTISFEATSEQQISAGSTVTYELRGTVASASSGLEYVDVSIANPATSATTTAAYATVLNDLGDADTSFIWTDRSSISTVHSQTTADWTDDYLVRTLPLTIGSRSVSI